MKYPSTILLLITLTLTVIGLLMMNAGGVETLSPRIKWAALAFELYLSLLAILLLLFRQRRSVRNFIINQCVLLGSVLLVALTLKAADFMLGKFRRNWDLIFLPNTSAHYVTPEFDYAAAINRFGLRGPKDMETPSAETFNVLMVGDSFTFGWGLAYQDTWPVRVEERLRAEGLGVRVFNLGKPGSSPLQYGQVVEVASRLLKPDLVVINILQGDDLFQLAPSRIEGVVHQAPRGSTAYKWQRLRERFRQFLPNLHGMLFGGGIFGNPAIEADIASDWVKQARSIYQDLSPAQQERFAALDDTIRTMYFQGQLNPKLVLDGVITPGRFFYHENLDAPPTQAALRALQGQLRKIRETARQARSDLLVSLVPYTPYVSQASQRTWKGMGYELDDQLLQSHSSETAVREAAQAAGLDFYSPLEEFRQAAIGSSLYYEYDGHFNPAGAELYARYMTSLIQSRIGAAAAPKSSSGRP